MKAQLNSTVPSMIFTEDLKTVIHSCEDVPEDIEMCVHMMKRLASDISINCVFINQYNKSLISISYFVIMSNNVLSIKF